MICSALGEQAEEAAPLRALVEAQQDYPVRAVRQVAGWALSQIPQVVTKSLAEWAAQLKDTDLQKAQEAAIALGRLDDPQAARPLLEFMMGPASPPTPVAAGTKETAQWLQRATAQWSALQPIRARVVRALKKERHPVLAPALLALVRDPSPDVRAQAAGLLKWLEGP
jgi:HEAT repeat protein